MSLKLKSSGGGSVILADPASTATDYTANIPLRNGNIAMDGPAFSAYRGSSAQSISAGAWTKLQYQTEEFDTASCYDNATNYRFTPNVAGYYQVQTTLEPSVASTYLFVSIYKNGSDFKRNSVGSTSGTACEVSALVYLNGTTDYIEAYILSAGAISTGVGAAVSYFQASMVRSA